MAVTSKVPYRVKETTLKNWLEKNIGNDDSGKPLYKYEDAKDKHAVHFWQVTAPRLITENETEDMKKEEIKKDKAQNIFKSYDEDEG